MATIPVISLDPEQYVDANTLSGVTVGTDMRLQNLSSGYVKLVIGATQPALDANNYIVIPNKVEYPADVLSETETVWLLGDGKVSIQEV